MTKNCERLMVSHIIPNRQSASIGGRKGFFYIKTNPSLAGKGHGIQSQIWRKLSGQDLTTNLTNHITIIFAKKIHILIKWLTYSKELA